MLAETPFQVILPPIFVAITWEMTRQVRDLWRYIHYTLIMIVITFIGQSLGYMIGAVYMNNLAAAVYMAPLSCIPFMLFSGIFVKISALPPYMGWLTWFSYIRFGIEGQLVAPLLQSKCDQ